MRKDYKRPELLVERFELTQQLAGCVLKIGFNSSTCVINDTDAPPEMKEIANAGVFITKCDEYIQDVDYEDGICYHTSVNLAFTS